MFSISVLRLITTSWNTCWSEKLETVLFDGVSEKKRKRLTLELLISETKIHNEIGFAFCESELLTTWLHNSINVLIRGFYNFCDSRSTIEISRIQLIYIYIYVYINHESLQFSEVMSHFSDMLHPLAALKMKGLRSG